MEVQVTIGFDQLIQIVKTLLKRQLNRLIAEIEAEKEKDKDKSEPKLEESLLKGPVATKKQLETFTNNRKSINQWRTI